MTQKKLKRLALTMALVVPTSLTPDYTPPCEANSVANSEYAGGSSDYRDWIHFNPTKFKPAERLVPSAGLLPIKSQIFSRGNPTFPHDPTRANVVFGRGQESLPTEIYAKAFDILSIKNKFFQAPAAGDFRAITVEGKSITLYGTTAYTPLSNLAFVGNPVQVAPFNPTRIFYQENDMWPSVIYGEPGQEIAVAGQKLTVPASGKKVFAIFDKNGRFKGLSSEESKSGKNETDGSKQENKQTEKSATEHSAADKTATEKASKTSNEKSAEKSTAEKTSTEKSATEKSVTEKTAAEKSAAEKSAAEAAAEKAAAEKAAAEKAAAEAAAKSAAEAAAKSAAEAAAKSAAEAAAKSAAEAAAKSAAEAAAKSAAEAAAKSAAEAAAKAAAEAAAKAAAEAAAKAAAEAAAKAAAEAAAKAAAEAAAKSAAEAAAKAAAEAAAKAAADKAAADKAAADKAEAEKAANQPFSQPVSANVCWFNDTNFKPIVRGDVSGTVTANLSDTTIDKDIGGGVRAIGSIKTEQANGVTTKTLIIKEFRRPGQLGPCNPQLQIPLKTIKDPEKPKEQQPVAHKSRPKKGTIDPAHEDFYKKICDAYDRLPESVKKWLDDHNYQIIVDLKIPEAAGPTWGCHREGEIHMGYQFGGSGSDQLITEQQIDLYSGLTHEIGHSIDDAYNLSSGKDFDSAYQLDKSGMNANNKATLDQYKDGGGSGANNYANEGPGEFGKNTTKGKQEVAADLLSYIMGANSHRPNDVSNGYAHVRETLLNNPVVAGFEGSMQTNSKLQ
jgi:hypothetical protein